MYLAKKNERRLFSQAAQNRNKNIVKIFVSNFEQREKNKKNNV